MAWTKFASVSVANGSQTVTVNSAEDISILNINDPLIVNNFTQVAIKKAYLGAENAKIIELFEPFPHPTQTAKPARVPIADAGLAKATAALIAVNDVVKEDFPAVGIVADNIAAVTTAAGGMAAINAVNSNQSNINTVSDNIAKVGNVSANIASVSTAATNMAAIIAAPTEANRAKTEADRSYTEAERAASYANANADIVAASMAPFPDVWIPFSDNLRMLAGYGDNIKVGDYTVATKTAFSRASAATYIDKSGVLREAAINEPRFEKEGLLIEGQSTNLYLTSTSMSHNVIHAGTGSLVPDACWPGHLGQTFTEDTTDAYHRVDIDRFYDFTADQEITSSLVIKVVGGKSVIRFQADASFAGLGTQTISCKFNLATGQSAVSGSNPGFTNSRCALRPLSNGWFRLEWTFTPKGTMLRRPLRVSLQADYNNDTANHTGNPSDKFTLTTPQVEALPFATSYIPTAGATATRAGDACSIPWAGNIESIAASNTVTACLEYDVFGSGVNHNHRIMLNHNGGTGSNYILRLDNNTLTISFFRGGGTNAAVNAATLRKGVVATVIRSDNTIKLAVNGQLYGGGVYGPVATGTPALLGIGGTPTGTYQLFGHIRNVRIWNVALTDAQLKVLK